MAASPNISIPPAALDVLLRSTVENNALTLPDEQLDRPLYEAVNKVLVALGGKWNRAAKAHLFPSDPGMALAEALEAGSVLDATKAFQFYPTPAVVADGLLSLAAFPADFSGTVLEPSAGDGALVRAILRRAPNACVDACELDPRHIPALEALGARWCHGDFLTFTPPSEVRFPFIIANPPFTRGQAVRHADRMLDLLAPGGTLACILDAGATFRADKATLAFRERLATETRHTITRLESGAFKSSGTLVSTVILIATRH